MDVRRQQCNTRPALKQGTDLMEFAPYRLHSREVDEQNECIGRQLTRFLINCRLQRSYRQRSGSLLSGS